MKTLFRGIIFTFSLVTTLIMLLAIFGLCSIFLIIGIVNYVKNDIAKDGLENAKSSKERVSNRSRFNNWLGRLVKDS